MLIFKSEEPAEQSFGTILSRNTMIRSTHLNEFLSLWCFTTLFHLKTTFETSPHIFPTFFSSSAWRRTWGVITVGFTLKITPATSCWRSIVWLRRSWQEKHFSTAAQLQPSQTLPQRWNEILPFGGPECFCGSVSDKFRDLPPLLYPHLLDTEHSCLQTSVIYRLFQNNSKLTT